MIRRFLPAVLPLLLIAALPVAGHDAPSTTFPFDAVDHSGERPHDVVGAEARGMQKQFILTISHGNAGHTTDGFLIESPGPGHLLFDAEASYWTQRLRSGEPVHWNVTAEQGGQALRFEGGHVAEGNTFAPYVTFDVAHAGRDVIPVRATAYHIVDDGHGGVLRHIVGSGATELVVDGVQPRIQRALTQDLDRDGHVDRVRLELAKVIDPATIDPADFAVDGRTILAAAAEGTAEPRAVHIDLAQQARADTALPLRVTLAAGHSLQDANGNPVQEGTLTTTDGAAPRLLRAHADHGSATVTLVWSEGVYGSASDGSLAIEDLASEGGGARILSVTHHAGNATATVLLESPWHTDDPFTSYMASKATVKDGAGNGRVHSIAVSDAAPSLPVTFEVAPGPDAATSLRIEWRGPAGSDGVDIAASTAPILSDAALDAAIVHQADGAGAADTTLTGLRPDTPYYLAARAWAAGIPSPWTALATTTGPLDPTPPSAIEGLTWIAPMELQDDGTIRVQFAWNASIDPETAVTYRVAATPGIHTLDGDDTTLDGPNWTVDLQPGAYHIHVAAVSAGGMTDQATLIHVVPDLLLEKVRTVQRAVAAHAVPATGGNQLTWVLPEAPATLPYAGVRIIHVQDAATVLVDIPADDARFSTGYFHGGGTPGSRYVVAPYFGETQREGLLTPDQVGSLGMISVDVPVANLPLWAWIGIAFGAVTAMAAVLFALARRSVRRDGGEDALWSAPHEAPRAFYRRP